MDNFPSSRILMWQSLYWWIIMTLHRDVTGMMVNVIPKWPQVPAIFRLENYHYLATLYLFFSGTLGLLSRPCIVSWIPLLPLRRHSLLQLHDRTPYKSYLYISAQMVEADLASVRAQGRRQAYIYIYIYCMYISHTYNRQYAMINFAYVYYTYVHTYIRTYVHTYIRTYAHTYIHTSMGTYIHIYIPTYTHAFQAQERPCHRGVNMGGRPKLARVWSCSVDPPLTVTLNLF